MRYVSDKKARLPIPKEELEKLRIKKPKEIDVTCEEDKIIGVVKR